MGETRAAGRRKSTTRRPKRPRLAVQIQQSGVPEGGYASNDLVVDARLFWPKSAGGGGGSGDGEGGIRDRQLFVSRSGGSRW